MRKKIGILSLLIVAILNMGAGCGLKTTPQKSSEIELNYWRVWDGEDTMADIIKDYNQRHPYVNINYKLVRYEEYEQKLLEAFASGRQPDIFSVHNTWTRKFKNRHWLEVMPPSVEMTHYVVKQGLKDEIIPEKRINSMPNLNDIRNKFVDVVYDDVVIPSIDEKTQQESLGVYGLPLGMDTLVMLVNRDLLNNAGITDIPAYWNKEFQQTIRKLSKQDNKGKIVQAGAALGGGNNVERSSDILSALMMQNGTEMMNLKNTSVSFQEEASSNGQGARFPSLDALRFYTDFANPAKEIYSWNIEMDNSLELFKQGKVALMFGYTYMVPQIKATNPKMNLAVAKLPQIEGNTPVNYANYWVESVAAGGKNSDVAWDFLNFASSAEEAKKYLDKSGRLTARRDLVSVQREDLSVGPYVDQVLTARSWYKGNDPAAAEKALRDTIDRVIKGEVELERAIGEAAQKVQQTIDEDPFWQAPHKADENE